MNRYGIITDSHGWFEGTEAICAALSLCGAEEIWHLGDVLTYGPFPIDELEFIISKQDLEPVPFTGQPPKDIVKLEKEVEAILSIQPDLMIYKDMDQRPIRFTGGNHDEMCIDMLFNRGSPSLGKRASKLLTKQIDDIFGHYLSEETQTAFTTLMEHYDNIPPQIFAIRLVNTMIKSMLGEDSNDIIKETGAMVTPGRGMI